MSDALAVEILGFWFGPPDVDGLTAKRECWFKVDPEFDAAIAARFGEQVARAIDGRLDGMAVDPSGTLALLLLLDQFTRNIHRGTPDAFAGDPRARSVANAAIGRGFDQALTLVQRSFVYLPFEHSEALADQEKSVALFAASGDPAGIEYAERHRDIIVRFGRFPHRNAILGRVSTPEEIEFLNQPGSSF